MNKIFCKYINQQLNSSNLYTFYISKLKIEPLGFRFLNIPAHAHNNVTLLKPLGHILRALTRLYRGRLTTPSQLKLAEYFPNWVCTKFLNPKKLKNIYHWFFVHTRDYKLQFDYDHLSITILH